MGFFRRLLGLDKASPAVRRPSQSDDPRAAAMAQVRALNESVVTPDRAARVRGAMQVKAAKARILESFDEGDRQKRMAETVRRMLADGRPPAGGEGGPPAGGEGGGADSSGARRRGRR